MIKIFSLEGTCFDFTMVSVLCNDLIWWDMKSCLSMFVRVYKILYCLNFKAFLGFLKWGVSMDIQLF